MLRGSQLTSEGRGGHEKVSHVSSSRERNGQGKRGRTIGGLALIREGPERGQGWLSAEENIEWFNVVRDDDVRKRRRGGGWEKKEKEYKEE